MLTIHPRLFEQFTEAFPLEFDGMILFRCIALAFIGLCAAINIRHGVRNQVQGFASPTVTHLIKDPIGALGMFCDSFLD